MKHTYLVFVILVALGVTSCRTAKNKKADDDFYDFGAAPVKDAVDHPVKAKTTQGGRTYKVDSDGTYTKSKVSSRFEKVEVVTGKIDHEAKYYIILGSFSEKGNAHRLSERLAKQGFSPNILRSESGMYRVSGYYFNDEQAARMEVADIREKHPEYSDLWLLIKK